MLLRTSHQRIDSPRGSRSRAPLLVLAAKGKGGDKKGGSKKGVSALAGLMKKKQEAEEAKASVAQPGSERASPEQYRDPEVRGLLFALATSYFQATKKYLVDGVDLEQLPDALFNANFVLLSHDRFLEGVTDPVFTYANKAALELWDTDWDTLIGMPSRKSALDDPEVQKDRQALLDKAAATRAGVITGYDGWRVSVAGKKFKIKDVTLFNILDFGGDKIGQAAVFDKYELEDGTEVQVKGGAWEAPQVELPPTEADVAAAATAVEEQAAAVRQLKEAQGLTNQDPEVQAAVAELKARKERLERLRHMQEEALAAAESAFEGADSS